MERGAAGITRRWGGLVDWMPELSLVLLTTLAGWWAAGRWLDPAGDPGIWWSAIFRLSRGERLYRDVYLQFGPLSPYLLAFGARLFGATARYLLVVTWIPAVLAGMFLLRAAKGVLSQLERFALAGLLVSESLLAPGPGRLVFPYAPAAVHAIVLSIAALLTGVPSSRPNRHYLAGVLAGLAFCSKQEIGLACALALVAAAVDSRPGGVARAARSGAGFAVVALLGAAIAFASAPAEILRDRNHLWPLAFAPPDRWSHLYRWVAGVSVLRWEVPVFHWIWWSLWAIVLAAVAALLAAREKKIVCWLPTAAVLGGLLFFWPDVRVSSLEAFRPIALSLTVSILAALGSLFARKMPGRSLAFGLSLFAALVGARTAFSAERAGPYSGIGHFTAEFAWVLFLCVLASAVVPGGDRAAAYARKAWGVILLLVSAVGVIGGVASLSEPAKETVETPQGRITVTRALAPFFRAIGSHLREGQKVWVLPEINGVDALFTARNVSPYPSLLPGWLDDEAQRNLIRLIERDPPDVVIVFERATKEYGVGEFGEGYDQLLSDWIDRNFTVVESMPAGRILRPKRDRPGGNL